MEDKPKQTTAEIRKMAMAFDNTVTSKDVEFILSSFSDDCEIELMGVHQ